MDYESQITSLVEAMKEKFHTQAEVDAFIFGARAGINALQLEDQAHYNKLYDVFKKVHKKLKEEVK